MQYSVRSMAQCNSSPYYGLASQWGKAGLAWDGSPTGVPRKFQRLSIACRHITMYGDDGVPMDAFQIPPSFTFRAPRPASHPTEAGLETQIQNRQQHPCRLRPKQGEFVYGRTHTLCVILFLNIGTSTGSESLRHVLRSVYREASQILY